VEVSLVNRLFLLVLIGVALGRAFADSPLTAFAPEVLGTASIKDVYAQSSGKVYVTGTLTKVNQARNTGNFVRLNPDGSLDSTFVVGPTVNGAVSRIIPLADSRFCILGSFSQVAGSVRPGIAILQSDGSLDTTFAPTAGVVPGTAAFAALDGSGRVLVACRGYSQQTYVGGKWTWQYPTVVVRLLSNGAVDSTFTKPTAGLSATNNYSYSNVGAYFVAPLPSGKILVGGDFEMCAGVTTRYLALLNSNGTADTTFSSPLAASTNDFYYGSGVTGAATSALAADGSIFIGGRFVLTGTAFQQGVVKLKSDLTVDPSFRIAFAGSFSSSAGSVSIQRLAVDLSGHLAVVGNFDGIEQQSSSGAAFVDSYGRPTGSVPFGNSDSVSLRADGYSVFGRAGGYASNGVVQPAIRAYLANGTIDTAFAPELQGPNRPSFLTVRPGNGVLIGGTWVKSVNDVAFPGIVALKVDGTIDSTFNCTVSPPNSVAFALPLPAGSYLLGGNFSQVNGIASKYLAVVDSAGALVRAISTADAPSSSVDRAYLLPNGKVLIGGYFTKIGSFATEDLAVLDLSQSAGLVDTSFKCSIANLYSIDEAVGLNDGTILVSGSFSNLASQGISGIAKLSATGNLDTTFKPLAAYQYPYVYGMGVDAAGRIVVGGSFYPGSGNTKHLLRINMDGSLDATLSDAAVSYVQSLRVENDFRIYIEGSFNSASGIIGEVGRLNDNGSPDASLSIGQSSVDGFALAPPNTLYLWGTFTALKGEPHLGVGAFSLTTAVPPSVDVSPRVYSAYPGQNLTLNLLSRGSAESVRWFKDNELLSSDLNLLLGPINAEDAGIYTVKVTNTAGTTTVPASLSADGTAPTPPPVDPTPTSSPTATQTPNEVTSFPAKLRIKRLKQGVQIR
jgi:uncharacterized delta-60 repeat protein